MNWRQQAKQEANPDCKCCEGKGIIWIDIRDHEGCADIEEIRCYICSGEIDK